MEREEEKTIQCSMTLNEKIVKNSRYTHNENYKALLEYMKQNE